MVPMARQLIDRSVREKIVLVGVALGDTSTDEVDGSLDELSRLVDTAGADEAARVVQRRKAPDPAYFVGKGKAEELRDEVKMTGADLVVFDNDLSPAQGKNLEDLIGKRVLDRSELILDIFADRARTREAKLQVELAQLQYLLPRLKRMWTHLSRIRGGIGLRGPGETQLEVDRRVIRDRIATLKEKLGHIEERRRLQRKGRIDAWNVALVGYTNVGKSTIMNRLSGEQLLSENRLFATLDATTRRIRLAEGEEILLTDTVGFIRNLPHHLVASFRATLEEVVHADLLLHVIDVSEPDHESQTRVVQEVLAGLGVVDTPTLLVFNKFDRIPAAERAGVRARLLSDHPGAVTASAVDPRGLVALEEALAGSLRAEEVRVRVTLPLSASRSLARLYEVGEVLGREYTEDAVVVEMRARPDVVERLRQEGVVVRVAS